MSRGDGWFDDGNITTVIEKRAPTDDSIKLYEKIKTKAYESIVDSIVIKDNKFNLKAILAKDLLVNDYRCLYKLTLNGMVIKGDINVGMEKNKQQLYEIIFRHVSNHFAGELINLIDKDG